MDKILAVWESLTQDQKQQIILISAGAGGMLSIITIWKIVRRVGRWLFRKPPVKTASVALGPQVVQREIADGVSFKDYQDAVRKTYDAVANEVNYQRQQNAKLLSQLTEALQPTEERNDDRAAEVAWLRAQNKQLTEELLSALRSEDD